MVQGRAYNVTNLPAKAQEISYHSTIFFSRTKQIFLPLSSLIFAWVLRQSECACPRCQCLWHMRIAENGPRDVIWDRLLLVFALRVGHGANGFAIWNFRRFECEIDVVAFVQFGDDDFNVLLTRPGQQEFLRLRIA